MFFNNRLLLFRPTIHCLKKHLNLGGRSSREKNGFKKYLLIGLVSYRNLQEKVPAGLKIMLKTYDCLRAR